MAEATTVSYAALREALWRNGTPIPANDAWIGALALQHRLPGLSPDLYFDHIPHVSRLGW